MKAIVQNGYGAPDVLELTEIQAPSPGDDEVLIRVRATTVTAVDCIFRRGDDLFARLFTGLLKPKHPVLGGEFAGEVAAVGRNVSDLKPGDEVFGPTAEGVGAHAEFVCLPAAGALAAKPPSMTLEQAAVVPYGALTSLPFMRDEAKVQRGQRVLVIGASGPVGATAVQLAKYYGAEVTGVCSGRNVELVHSLGADHVIDYTKDDFTKSGGRYHVIFDPAAKSSFSRCKGLLVEEGLYLSAAITPGILLQMLWTSMMGRKKAKIAFTGLRAPSDKKEDLAFVTELIEAGKLTFPIDGSYRLECIRDAHERVENGHRGGHVVVTLDA